tara:strand:- start:345 stop:560 length:216 start_codon:yes stop_codon:yes gene_type:complete
MSDPLEKLYEKIFEEAMDYMKEHEVQMVAATYMAIAMRLYKTHLTDEGFVSMVRTVMESEVEPYEPKKILH